MKLIVLAVIALTSLCAAKPHYVDFVNGSDAASGGSPSDPWKHCPGDDSATARARGAALRPGDTVFFRGGIIYRGQIAMKWSGHGDAPVVYDGNSSGQWGWDKAVIDGETTRNFGFYTDDSPVSYVVVNNFQIRNLNYNAAMTWGSGKGIYCNACTSVTIANCYVHDIGYWKNDGSKVPAGNGIKMLRASNCIVTRNEVTRCGESGIWLDGAQHCTISRNNVHDNVTWGIDLSGDCRLCANNTICDNIVHDLYQFDKGFWKGSGDPPHQDFIFIRMGSGTHPVHNLGERNLLYNNFDFTDFGGTAMMFLSYADSTVIRNNVLINAHSYSAVYFGWTSTGTRLYSNTIYCPRTGALRLSTSGDNGIYNNIFVAQSSGIIYDSIADERKLIMDHNLYCIPDDGKAFARAVPWAGWNFAAWQGRGFDAHSSLLASVSGFKFVNIDGYPLHCQAMDLRPLPGSPVERRVGRIRGLGFDTIEDIRAAGAAWDKGMFSFVPNSPDSLAALATDERRKQKE